jgi:hypothetical protein
LNSKSIIGGMIQKRASHLNLVHLANTSHPRRRPKDRLRNPSKSSSRNPYSSRSATSWSSLGSWMNPSTTSVPSSASGSSSLYPPSTTATSSGRNSEQVPLLFGSQGAHMTYGNPMMVPT